MRLFVCIMAFSFVASCAATHKSSKIAGANTTSGRKKMTLACGENIQLGIKGAGIAFELKDVPFGRKDSDKDNIAPVKMYVGGKDIENGNQVTSITAKNAMLTRPLKIVKAVTDVDDLTIVIKGNEIRPLQAYYISKINSCIQTGNSQVKIERSLGHSPSLPNLPEVQTCNCDYL